VSAHDYRRVKQQQQVQEGRWGVLSIVVGKRCDVVKSEQEQIERYLSAMLVAHTVFILHPHKKAGSLLFMTQNKTGRPMEKKQARRAMGSLFFYPVESLFLSPGYWRYRAVIGRYRAVIGRFSFFTF
jgi:hypothetical protein